MTKRPGDKTAETPGGRAAERLRMFEEARRRKKKVSRVPKKKKKRAAKNAKKDATVKKGALSDEE